MRVVVYLLMSLIVISSLVSACVTPSSGLSITSDTELCGGQYSISHSITVDADNVHVKCLGTVFLKSMGTLTDPSPLKVDGHSNVVIEGCVSQDYTDGFTVSNSDHVVLNNVSLDTNYFSARHGVHVIDSKYITIANSSFYSVPVGIYAENSNSSTIENNRFRSIEYPIVETGDCTSRWVNNSDMDSGAQVLYVNISDRDYSSGSYFEIYVCDVNNVNFTGLDIYGAGYIVYGLEDVVISNNLFHNVYHAVDWYTPASHKSIRNLTFVYNTVEGNSGITVDLTDSYIGNNQFSGLNTVVDSTSSNTYFENNSVDSGSLNFEGSSWYIVSNDFHDTNNFQVQASGSRFLNNSIQVPNRVVNLVAPSILAKYNEIKFSSQDGVYLSGDFLTFSNNLVCGSTQVDVVVDTGGFIPPSVSEVTCDSSDPDGYCSYQCPSYYVVSSVLPQNPSSSDTIRCAAFVNGGDMDVEFQFYIDGVADSNVYTVSDCQEDSYCYSPSVGPYPVGTSVSCRARGQYGSSYTDWSMSDVVEVTEPSTEGGTSVKPETLPMVVFQRCEGTSRVVEIYTEPDTSIIIRKSGSLIDKVDVDDSGMVSVILDDGNYTLVGINSKYTRQERDVSVISCLPVGYECLSSWDCESDQICADGQCVNLSCGYCQYPENHMCLAWQCCADNDCGSTQVCNEHVCVNLDCGNDQFPMNHQCVSDEGDSSSYDNNIQNLYAQYHSMSNKLNQLEEQLDNLRRNMNKPDVSVKDKYEVPFWMVVATVSAVILSFGSSVYLYLNLRSVVKMRNQLVKVLDAMKKSLENGLDAEDVDEIQEQLPEDTYEN